MGTRRHLQASDACREATALELWAAGELHDDEAQGETAPTTAGIVGLVVALATFFIVFAPPF